MLNARVALDKTFLTTLSSLISCSVPIRRTAVQPQPHIARTTVAPSRAGCAVLLHGKADGVTRTAAGPVRRRSLGSPPSPARGGDHPCMTHEEGANIAP